ncbi:MAG: hypothetical protein IKQ77_13720 [Prevotella sp.]|nr:hypothetical protein [Prevotella sp.]
MNNYSLEKLVTQALPTVSERGLTYNADRNMFLTQGYTSLAGNTYFQGIQLTKRLAIVYDIGVGYAHSFLNGIKLYCFDGRQKKLIGQSFYYSQFFTDAFARIESIRMLVEYLKTQAKMLGAYVSDDQLNSYAKEQVTAAATQRHLLE